MIVGLPEEANPDFSKLIEMVRGYAKSVIGGEHCDDDDDVHYIFEEAVCAVYGPKAFDYLNQFIE